MKNARRKNSYGVIPPHLLSHLIENGSEHQRRCALNTLTLDSRFRARTERITGRTDARRAEAGQPLRYIFDAQHRMELPGERVRREGEPATGDRAVDEAHDDLGATWQFFHDIFQRAAIDGENGALLGTVHYGEEYQNAFWNGYQMVFGDGDGEIFVSFTRALDVVAHELTHGIIERESGLVYHNQPGALNESIADVFGAMVAQYTAGLSVEAADWTIGGELLAPGINGVGLRSMSHPGSAYDDPLLGRDPQPDHMRGFVETSEDNGGVHINSGIPNRAFYLAATALGGYSWERAGRVWYATLLDERLANDAGFSDFAHLTLDNARAMFDSDVSEAVRDGWRTVGVDV
ncbi:M4 family metallopeptidase [Kushneria aurantia]|uniref:Neutral metalloproteinase n=1 Tax=Kushneria aurantia TaxID=504092 RepID=A0ABV6G6P1_9GAMM|nr:M4 family metallopeptidase [Kushneria aurantia]